jgi:hypothetical protein
MNTRGHVLFGLTSTFDCCWLERASMGRLSASDLPAWIVVSFF